jgi:fluoride exporter
MMIRTLFLIGTGGFIGSIFRYLTAVYVTKLMDSSFPYGILVVNILGSFVIGLIFGLSDRFNWPAVEWRIFLATGICGGYTTFSTFSYETISLLREGDWFLGISNISFSVVFCLAATFFGGLLVRVI